AAVTEILAGGLKTRLAPAPSAVTLILGVQPRLRPVSSRRRALAVAGAGAVTMLVLGGWAFASSTPYPLVSRTLGLTALSRLPTVQPQVALIVDAPPALIPAIEQGLAIRHAHASFAFDT